MQKKRYANLKMKEPRIPSRSTISCKNSLHQIEMYTGQATINDINSKGKRNTPLEHDKQFKGTIK